MAAYKRHEWQIVKIKIPDEIVFASNTISDSQDDIEKLHYFFSTISDKLKAQYTKPTTNADIDWKTIKYHVHSLC